MADKTIGSLPKATELDAESLMVTEQLGEARCITGELLANYAKEAAQAEADKAQGYANNAEKSANTASEKAEEAQNIALKPPMIRNGNWWIWNEQSGDYTDSGIDASTSLSIADTITGEPGTEASVENIGTESDLILRFTIPRGEKGELGSVDSVNSKTGVVELTAEDIPVTAPSAKPSWTNTEAYLNGLYAEKGAANGVATLDSNSKIPIAQIPSLNYIPTTEKGAANGVATLDSGAKVPVPQIPAANSLQVLNLGPIPTSDRLQTGQDLNDYTTSGSYWCTTSAIAGSLINCPYKGRFKLVVDDVSSGGEIVYQYIIPGHTSENSVYTIYYRVYDIWVPASPWGNWKTLLSVVGGNKNSIQQTSALLNLRQEEGAWTPVLIARSGPAVSYTITENRGCKYWTLGDWVYITCYLRVRITAAGDGSSGSRSYAGIQGLPFAVSTESRYPITVTELYGCVSNNWDVGYIDDDGGSSVYFQKDDGAAQEWWMVNSSSTDGGINFCGWYKKAT